MSSHASVSPLEPVSRPLELIEREITQLAAAIAADCCRWLGLIAEFDSREGWAQWGCHSCAHWVSWQCAVAPPAAREYVRVARRLEQLPGIRAAFAAGELSYSKVRALTRVGTVEREAELLDLARDATAAQLERLVRAYRGVEAVERAAAGEAPERYLRLDAADDGGVLIRGRLSAEEGALLAKALEAARADPDRRHAISGAAPTGVSAAASAHEDRAGPGVSAETRATRGERDADALVLMADTMLAHGAAARSGADRYQVVVHVDADTITGHDAAGRCHTDNGEPLAAETGRRLACDASLVALLHRNGRPFGVGRKTRTVGPALRRALAARDPGCRFPGCDRHTHLHAHHIEHWAHGGPTDLPNLVHLCHRHHRLLHEGDYTLARRADQLEFRRPDGRIIPSTTTPGRAAPDRTPRHTSQVAALAPGTGERLDLALAVDALRTFAPLRSRPARSPEA